RPHHDRSAAEQFPEMAHSALTSNTRIGHLIGDVNQSGMTFVCHRRRHWRRLPELLSHVARKLVFIERAVAGFGIDQVVPVSLKNGWRGRIVQAMQHAIAESRWLAGQLHRLSSARMEALDRSQFGLRRFLGLKLSGPSEYRDIIATNKDMKIRFKQLTLAVA